MEAHRADVLARLAEMQENLKLIDHKIDVYRGRLRPATPTSYGRPSRRPVTEAAATAASRRLGG